MKWFKHYSDASSSIPIQRMMKKHGVLGYGQYFLLLELACLKFNGSDCVIDLSLTELAMKLKIKSSRVQVILKSFQESNLLRFSCDDFIFKIELPILLDLQGKDFKHNRSKIAPVSQDATPEKDKDKDKEKEKKIYKKKPSNIANAMSYDFELIYSHYPRKEGKKAGVERLKKIITSQEKFDQVLQSVKNYALLSRDKEKQFIKHFSSFVSNWEDYLGAEIESEIDPMKALREKYKYTEVD